MNYKMIKYNIVVSCYDKMLVNAAAYVIPGLVCVCVWCRVNGKWKWVFRLRICAYVGTQ